jgi:hypothetical protein
MVDKSTTDLRQVRPIYVLKFRPLPGIDAIRSLRAILKFALRGHGLRCISAQEIPPQPVSPPGAPGKSRTHKPEVC